MKKRRLLPAACSLALIASVCLFIGYATDTLPQHTQRQKTAAPQVMTQKNETEKHQAIRDSFLSASSSFSY